MLTLVTRWRHDPDEHVVYIARDVLWGAGPEDERFVLMHGDKPESGSEPVIREPVVPV